ncbi:MAG: hypothetical protein LBI77_03595, partial [Puniceicoccales bacterium]|jgi:hypothetical protein|nr:hypothetical protein [Puniceicoccales bacterium]
LAAKAENTGFLKTAMDAFKDNDKQLQTEILKDIINACIEEKEEEEGIKLLAKVIEGYDDTTKNDLLNLLKNDDKYNSLEEAMELNRKNQ